MYTTKFFKACLVLNKPLPKEIYFEEMTSPKSKYFSLEIYKINDAEIFGSFSTYTNNVWKEEEQVQELKYTLLYHSDSNFDKEIQDVHDVQITNTMEIFQ